jgi:hypothetical protein
MQGSLLLQLLILLVVANGSAVVAKKLLGVTFARPLDGGALFVDGQPIFGPSKTIRGIVVSVLAILQQTMRARKKKAPKLVLRPFQLEIAGRELNNYETTATS